MQENFTPADREKRKEALAKVLCEAADAGVVPTASVDRLADFLTSRDFDLSVPTSSATPVEAGLSTLLAAEPDTPVEESEAPRFVRGFHDILISIGLVVLFSGLWGVANSWGKAATFLLLAAVVVLAEILVRRQRLALPAFVLTGFFAVAVVLGMRILMGKIGIYGGTRLDVANFAALSVFLGIFYWRYRVPVALAGFIACAYETGIFFIYGIAVPSNIRHGPVLDNPWIAPLLVGTLAVLVFATALWLDLRDRERKTRRSDVAFWLFLVAAPSLVYAAHSVIFYGKPPLDWFGADASSAQAIASVATIAVLMLIGILLDRRAFVTSGLLSLGLVIQSLVTSGLFAGAIPDDRIIYITMLLIGIVVLSLGIGWQMLRRLIVSRLPGAWQARLPPIRG